MRSAVFGLIVPRISTYACHAGCGIQIGTSNRTPLGLGVEFEVSGVWSLESG